MLDIHVIGAGGGSIAWIDEAGRPTVTERRRTLDMPVLLETAMTCDFEADVSWVLGLTAPGGYRIAELDGPPRLVVDVRR